MVWQSCAKPLQKRGRSNDYRKHSYVCEEVVKKRVERINAFGTSEVKIFGWKCMANINSFTERMMPVEEWKRIYLNSEKSKYMVSSLGHVINDRNMTISPIVWGDGRYLMYSFNHKGKKVRILAHRLVAEYFCCYDYTKYQIKDLTVNHIDGNKHNNVPSNLEWITIKGNIHHEFDTGLNPSGGKPYNKILATSISDGSVIMYPSMHNASKNTGVNVGNISRYVRSGNKNPLKGYVFEYAI